MNTESTKLRGKGGGSKRLLAHRLANYDAAQAKAAGPHFEAQWKAQQAGTSASAVDRQAHIRPMPAPAPTVAATPQPKPMLTAADRAVLEGQRLQRVAAQVAGQKAAAAKAAQQSQAEINASWRQVHAELRHPFSHVENEDPGANFGWAGVHAEIRASRPHYGEQA